MVNGGAQKTNDFPFRMLFWWFQLVVLRVGSASWIKFWKKHFSEPPCVLRGSSTPKNIIISLIYNSISHHPRISENHRLKSSGNGRAIEQRWTNLSWLLYMGDDTSQLYDVIWDMISSSHHFGIPSFSTNQYMVHVSRVLGSCRCKKTCFLWVWWFGTYQPWRTKGHGRNIQLRFRIFSFSVELPSAFQTGSTGDTLAKFFF